MANTKKPRSERKKVMSISIKTRHYEDFIDICSRKNLIPSNEVEKLIITFNKTIL